MKFGKLDTLSGVDFSLPPDAVGTTQLLARLTPAAQPFVSMGMTAWSVKEWVGAIYPKGAKPADFLKYYAHQFDTIELNTTHYRIPDLATIAKWKKESSPTFRFCPKVPMSISHSTDLSLSNRAVIEEFCENVGQLGEKLGACFIQLPPYFEATRMPLLLRFLDYFPAKVPLQVELRHESWFAPALHPVFDELEQRGIGSVITDVAGRRDVLHQRLTNDVAMIRFVGNTDAATDTPRMEAWMRRIGAWVAQGIKEVYFFVHQPDDAFAPPLATVGAKLFLEQTGISIKTPTPIVAAEPVQASLF